MTVRIDGNSASRCSSAGTATLYGRLATSAVGCSSRSRLLQGQDVAVQHRQPVDLAVRVLGDGLRKLACQHRIDLDGGHRGAAVQQRQRQRAQSGTDLEHVVVAVDAGRRHDAANGVGVVDEVLAERLTRPEVDLLGQVPNLGAPEQSNGQRAPNPPATHWPRAPTLTRPSDLSYRDLFFSCCQIGPRSIPQTTLSFPGVLVKLDAAVKTVTGVDGPITSRFALRQRVPRWLRWAPGALRCRAWRRPAAPPSRAGVITTLATGNLPVSTPLTVATANVTS